jgi:hypothetical protein
MDEPVSWEDQGRQQHGWFGSGTAPQQFEDTSDPGAMFGPGGLAARIQAVGRGAIGALPAKLRAPAAAQQDAGNLARLTEAMTAWAGGTGLSASAFAERFFGRTADDPVARTLHGAALDVGLATSHAELREAAEKVASAMQAIGLDRWPRFLADAQDRARDPATVAAVTRSRQPRDPGRDAIRPVYPLETLLGVGAVGVAGGAVAVARAAGRAIGGAIGGAILKQVLPKRPIPTMRITPDRPAAPSAEFDGAIQAARQSSDPGTQLEGQVAQHIKDAGIDVISFNKEFGPNASIGEIDVETPDAIIEVTRAERGKLRQIRKLMGNPQLNPAGKPVILYAPNYLQTAGKDVSNAGAPVVRTPEALINLLRSKGRP